MQVNRSEFQQIALTDASVVTSAQREKTEALDAAAKTGVSRLELLNACEDNRFNHKHSLNGFSYGAFFLWRRAQRHFVNGKATSVPPMVAYAALALPLTVVSVLTPPIYLGTAFLWGLRRDSVTAERVLKVRIKRYLREYLETRSARMNLQDLQAEFAVYEAVRDSIAARPWKTSRSFQISAWMEQWHRIIVRNEKSLRKMDGIDET